MSDNKIKGSTGATRDSQYRANIYHPGRSYPALYRKLELWKPAAYKKFLEFVDRQFPGWTAINVYTGLTRTFKKQINQKNRGDQDRI